MTKPDLDLNTVIDEFIRPTIHISTIVDHPLPVWYENTLNGIGNGAVSKVYVEEMGAICGEYSWKGCVLNDEYWKSYERFIKRKNLREVWSHELTWRNPTTGEVVRKLSRCKWLSEHEILGEVVDFPTSKHYFVRKLLVFACGFLLGIIVGGPLWQTIAP